MTPSDKQPVAETPEEIATRILAEGTDTTGRVFELRMRLAIIAALQNERDARRGCEHCSCVCDNCAQCGPSGKESELE